MSDNKMTNHWHFIHEVGLNTQLIHCVLCCWLGGRKSIRPVKTERSGTGVVICLDTHTHNRFTALWNLSGKTRVSRYQKNIHPLLSS